VRIVGLRLLLHLTLQLLTRAASLACSNGAAWVAEGGGSFSSAASGTERRGTSAPPRPPSQPPRALSSLSVRASAPGPAGLEDKLAWLEARVHAMAWSVPQPPLPLPPLWRHSSDEVRSRFLPCCKCLKALTSS
jgi:hypothetical protein